jgi:quercetin dioxygenase-like cupin family protein/type 1 glutamine amidotransferase
MIVVARKAVHLGRLLLMGLAGLIFVGGAGGATAANAPGAGPTIVLIGGALQGYAQGEHDYPDGILTIERLIQGSPQLQALHPIVKAFPTGFPADLAQIADADVVVLYFGLHYSKNFSNNVSPLAKPAPLAAMQQLMNKGAGLIALHQSFTVSDQSSKVPFASWLGAVRFGMADRTTETVPVRISGQTSPVANGLKDFDYLDEFYPTITFSTATKVTPVLTARLHVQFRNNTPVLEERPESRVIAWTAVRPNGGRSFGFTGAHYLVTFDQPQIRTMLLNAILWTAKRPVPPGGATTNAATMPHYGGRAAAAANAVVLRKAKALLEREPWGKLEWFASQGLGNSNVMTTGMVTIDVGKETPLHYHPNCDEILHVLRGRIMQRVADREYELQAGDTISIPEGMSHQTRNIGSDAAVLSLSYDSPDRISIGE